MYYTYAYLREDGTPYYIGKGKGRRSHQKHNGFYPPSKERILLLKQNLAEDAAFRHEVYMISIFGRKDLGNGILHNKTDGGRGCSHKIMTEQDLYNRRKGRLGKQLSESHKRRISEANTGTPKTMTEKRKQSDIEKGLRARGKTKPKHSEETKRKISEATQGRVAWNKGIADSNISGGKNPRAKKIFYNGKVYDCIKDAMKINNVSRSYILKNSTFIN
jgi:hypothetical protein